MPERRACGLARITWASARYRSHKDPQNALRMRLKELAAIRVSFGFERLTISAPPGGLDGQPKEGVSALQGGGPNQRWSMNLVQDRLEDGRKFRILTVVDQFTKECVVLHAKPRLRGLDVAKALGLAIRERGKPVPITVDDGSEFAGKVMNA